jgi:hypothetical protein
MTSELNEKRLELLREAVPRAQRIGVLFRENPDRSLRQWDKTMPPPMFFGARTIREVPQAFAAANKAGVGALLIYPDPDFYIERDQIVHLAAQAKMPAIYERDFVTAGDSRLWRRSPDLSRRYYHVHRILTGPGPDILSNSHQFRAGINLNGRAGRRFRLRSCGRTRHRMTCPPAAGGTPGPEGRAVRQDTPPTADAHRSANGHAGTCRGYQARTGPV